MDSASAGLRLGGLLRLLTVFFLAVAGPGALQAQSGGAASPLLSPNHWAQTALTRLHGAGLLVETFDPATTTIGRQDALLHFRHASDLARARAPEWVELADAYRDRFAEEFPGTARRVGGADGRFFLDAGVSGGFETRRHGLLARHQTSEGTPARTEPLEDLADPAAGLNLGAHLPGERVSWAGHVALDLHAGDVVASEAYGTVRVGRLGLWAGRRSLAFGTGEGRSVVLSGDVPFDGVGLFLSEGVRLPGPFRRLGTVWIETFVSQMDRSGDVESPRFFGLRTAWAPHPRVQVGINRGALFGGTGERVPPTTLTRILRMVAGIDTAEPGAGNFEDHVASMDLWFRPPLGAVPLVVYGEWGVEDLQAQRRDMPAFVTGARLAAVPGATWLSLGLERTSFGAPPGNRLSWYDHRVFGTWTDGGRLLAHPLGGEGRELRIYGAADVVDARVRLEGRAYTRRRDERNLFAPDREGTSRGVEGTVRWRFAPSMDAEASGALERGDGWRTGSGFLGMRLFF